MATLTVWKFNDPSGAEAALAKVEALQKQELIVVDDAATVSWPVGKRGPKTKQLNSLTGLGALDGAFWGTLFGLLFFIPIIGLVTGAALGALGGSLSDIGIDDDFINSVRSKVKEGTSALFLMSENAVVERVQEAFAGIEMELIASNLSSDQEANVAELFK